ncbi:hypothetical protein GJ496_004869 [Pomphorhynchus laevis]|nr:hypothetical protein GJ496_004869 [Pomphorhynchus laevis]
MILSLIFLIGITDSQNETDSFDLYEVYLKDSKNITRDTICVAVIGSPDNKTFNLKEFEFINKCGLGNIPKLQITSSEISSCTSPPYNQTSENVIFFLAHTDSMKIFVTEHLRNSGIKSGGVWLSKKFSSDFNDLKFAEIGRKLRLYQSGDKSNFVVIILMAVVSELGAILFGQKYYPVPIDGDAENIFYQNSPSVNARRFNCYRQICLVISLVVSGSSLLLTVYFFPKPLSYILHSLFAILAVKSFYEIVNALLISKIISKSSKLARILNKKLIKLGKYSLSVKVAVFYSLSLIFPILWIVFSYVDGYESSSYIYQNICLMALAIYFGSQMRISPFFTVLLIQLTLILYDVFFVYLTPLLFGNKAAQSNSTIIYYVFPQSYSSNTTSPSVMMKVATTLKNIAVFRVPYAKQPSHECNNDLLKTETQTFSILGLGDVLVPVILGNFCADFDKRSNNNSVIYTCVFMISYAIGLILAFVVSTFTLSGQPALLFINPCTLVCIIALSLIKRQFKSFVKS